MIVYNRSEQGCRWLLLTHSSVRAVVVSIRLCCLPSITSVRRVNACYCCGVDAIVSITCNLLFPVASKNIFSGCSSVVVVALI